MEQVKQDMDRDPSLKRAMDDLDQSTTGRHRLADTFTILRDRCVAASAGAGTVLDTAQQTARTAANSAATFVESTAALRGATQAAGRVTRAAVDVAGGFVDRCGALLTAGQTPGAQRAAEWRQKMAVKRYKQQHHMQSEYDPVDGKHTPNDHQTHQPHLHDKDDHYDNDTQQVVIDSLVVSHESAWDRFGTKLKDMPFLHNFYANPVLGKLLGETETAAALRKMKQLDSSFRLPELVELMEHVVAPHLVQAFLRGEAQTLQLHCGESAFAAVATSIKEREAMKLELDPSILILKDVDLRGARSVDSDGPPWFIFTFCAQQINCLRDRSGKVVSGAVDDIREVMYSVALCKHPTPDVEGLEYPWQVKELAIVGNAPSY